MKEVCGSLVAAAMAFGFIAGAQGQGVDPEATMRLFTDPAAELPDAVTRTLELPDPADETASNRSEDGLARGDTGRSRASENRASAFERAGANRAAGLEIAATARELGAEYAAEIAEAAVALRETLVRGRGATELTLPDDLPALPEHVSDRLGEVERPARRPELPPEAGPVAGAGGASDL